MYVPFRKIMYFWILILIWKHVGLRSLWYKNFQAVGLQAEAKLYTETIWNLGTRKN